MWLFGGLRDFTAWDRAVSPVRLQGKVLLAVVIDDSDVCSLKDCVDTVVLPESTPCLCTVAGTLQIILNYGNLNYTSIKCSVF